MNSVRTTEQRLTHLATAMKLSPYSVLLTVLILLLVCPIPAQALEWIRTHNPYAVGL